MKGKKKSVPGWWSVKAGKQQRAAVFLQPGLDSHKAGGGSEYGSGAAKPSAGWGRDLIRVTWNKLHLSCWLDFKNSLFFLISTFSVIKRRGCKSDLSH